MFVAGTFEKKSVQVAVKLAEQTFRDVEQICMNEDRPVGYVVRELMLRGLAAYRQDGHLRDPDLRLMDAFQSTYATEHRREKTQKIPVLKQKAK